MESPKKLLRISSCISSSSFVRPHLGREPSSREVFLTSTSPSPHHCQHEEHDHRRACVANIGTKPTSLTISRRLGGQASGDDIGDRIDKAKGHAEDGKSAFGRNMWYVVATIFVSFLALNVAVLLFSELALGKRFPNYNNKKYFTEFENPYDDIVKETILYVQAWYRELDTTKPLLALSTRSNEATSQGEECIQRWFANIEDIVAYSSPLPIEVVLMNLGLSDSNLVRMHLGTLLMEPQPMSSMLDSSSECLQSNVPMSYLCSALDDLGAMPSYGTSERQNVLEYLDLACSLLRKTHFNRHH